MAKSTGLRFMLPTSVALGKLFHFTKSHSFYLKIILIIKLETIKRCSAECIAYGKPLINVSLAHIIITVYYSKGVFFIASNFHKVAGQVQGGPHDSGS